MRPSDTLRQLRTFPLRLWRSLHPQPSETALDSEVQSHMQALAEEYRQRGMDEPSAWQAAKRDFGPLEPMKEQYRERARLLFLEGVGRDLGYGIRALRQTPAFTAIAVGSLALALGSNCAIFSFVEAILLAHLPVPHPEELVTLSEARGPDVFSSVMRFDTVEALAARSDVTEGLSGVFPMAANVSAGSAAEWVPAEMITGEYFRTLAVQPALGRLLNNEDVHHAAGDPACVISYGFWQTHFGGSANVLSQDLVLNGHSYRIIGVTSRGFAGSVLHRRAEIQVPASRIVDFMPAFNGANGMDWHQLSWLTPIARLPHRISKPQAEIRLSQRYNNIQTARRGGSAGTPAQLRLNSATQGLGNIREQYEKPLWVLVAVVGLVFLAACTNIASLLLARHEGRAREIAVRLSLGASRARLIQQLLLESLLIATAGSVVGIAVAWWMARTLAHFLNSGMGFGRAVETPASTSVLWFSMGLTALTVLAFGLVPAIQSVRSAITPALKQVTASAGGHRIALRQYLVVVQVALTIVILFSAGLLLRSLRSLHAVNLGIEPAKVIVLDVNPSSNGHSDVESARIYSDLLEGARRLPGVAQASLAFSTPQGSEVVSFSIEVPGYISRHSDNLTPVFNFISPGYFATIGEPLLAGRDLDEHDRATAPRVAIVNEKFARHYFPKGSVVGRKFSQGRSDITIVGVVKDARDEGIRSEPTETVFCSMWQGTSSQLTLLVRPQQKPEQMEPQLLSLVHNVDPHMPVFSIRTLDAQMEKGLTSERLLAFLSTLFASVVVALAALGIYGVVSYSVAQRTREIGIRMAIGAQREQVIAPFLAYAAFLIAGGSVLGIPCALLSVTLLRSLLFGLRPNDPATLAGSLLALLLVASLAILLPLWRASRVDPVIALRYE